jgi:hypothetical protein
LKSFDDDANARHLEENELSLNRAMTSPRLQHDSDITTIQQQQKEFHCLTVMSYYNSGGGTSGHDNRNEIGYGYAGDTRPVGYQEGEVVGSAYGQAHQGQANQHHAVAQSIHQPMNTSQSSHQAYGNTSVSSAGPYSNSFMGQNPSFSTTPSFQQQQQQLQQQQQQQQQPSISFWNPATAATVAAMAGQMATGMNTTGANNNVGYNVLNNDAMFDLAGAAGATILQQGSARMLPGMHTSMINLRQYFAVDNRFVSKKIRKVLFPFIFKQWARQVRVSSYSLNA